MEVLVFLVLFLAMTGHSSATYCICKDGVGDSALQKAIDYACGNGADCSSINQNGACYNPNTVKDHCNYAVNSYYQRKAQGTGTCDFAGSATTSASLPTQSSGCVYQSTPSNSNSSTPSTTPPSSTPPSGTTPSTTPSNTTPSTTTPSTTPSTTTTPTYNLGPTGTGYTDASLADRIHQNTNLQFPLAFSTAILWFSGFSLL